MSYDVSIGTFTGNYTSSCSAVWYDHFPNGNGLHGLNGMTGAQAAEEFEGFWKKLNETRRRLYVENVPGEPVMTAKYDASNGWGSLIGALIFVGQIQAACALHPDDTIDVDC